MQVLTDYAYIELRFKRFFGNICALTPRVYAFYSFDAIALKKIYPDGLLFMRK
jgi:hypothetical protein